MYSPKKQINLDITNKCALACPACDRQSLIKNKQRIDGKDISVESFRKIVDYFDHLIFCGQVSDPTHHDNFKDLLRLCVIKNKRVTINVASTIRDIGWFTRCFLLSKGRNVEWIFGIDGLRTGAPWWVTFAKMSKLVHAYGKVKDLLVGKQIYQNNKTAGK